MNRKQAVIIVTLLVLIVCAGVLATKVNSPLYVSDTDLVNSNNSTSNSSPTNSSDNNAANATTSSSSNYFADARLTREKTNAQTIATLKSIIDDKNASQANKDSATQQSINISTASTNATKVENMLKGKGYKEALCTINGDKVSVVVKSDAQKLSDIQQREIRDVVLSVTNLRNIEIEPPVH
ncbi:MAG: SpoIIIAH-like family protein [Clostridium sp.]|uniref:SpoIIIAH-like family protein n=1 Tax=Clostridium sp. TaxID=1506 RepID=UPI0039ED552A